MGFFVILVHQVETGCEEGVNLHDSFQKVTVKLVLEEVAALLDALILDLDLLVDLDREVLYVILETGDTFVQVLQSPLKVSSSIPVFAYAVVCTIRAAMRLRRADLADALVYGRRWQVPRGEDLLLDQLLLKLLRRCIILLLPL